ncbi:UNVERIFIED_CONTAM: hypothetical protein ITH36_25620 [Salmonella enterica subsp. enterica serovar Weltevreden]
MAKKPFGGNGATTSGTRWCGRCDKSHDGYCKSEDITCYRCKKKGHVARICPDNRMVKGRCYVMTAEKDT